MEHGDGMDMYIETINQKKDDRLFLRWSVAFQTMMSFDDFKAEVLPKKKETAKEIYKKVENILEATLNGNI